MWFGIGRGRRTGGRDFRRGKGAGGIGPGKTPVNCICPGCNLIIPHQLALPCFKVKCPRCGSHMTRQFLY